MELIEPSTTQFSTAEANFVIDVSHGYHRRPSDEEAFTIVKTPNYLNLYIELVKSFSPKTIVELGVFQGGGFVFLDCIFSPRAMSAVELAKTPVAALLNWIACRPNRYVHFGSNQTDSDILENIVRNELGGVLDMVVDDASHLYEETRRSFEILFPLMSPGGHYIIEDWAWSHSPLYQGPDAPHASKPALSNLIFDLVMLHGSTSLIAEIRVYGPFVIVRKSLAPPQIPQHFWQLIRNRGRAEPRI